ncbi:hypothetical protein WDU94_011229, partial [Cyamophila willieti]
MTLHLMSPLFSTPGQGQLLDLILFHPVFCTACTLALTLESITDDTKLSLYKLEDTLWNKLDTMVLCRNYFKMALHTMGDENYVTVAEFPSNKPSSEAASKIKLYEVIKDGKLVFVREFNENSSSSNLTMWDYGQDSYLAISTQSGRVPNHAFIEQMGKTNEREMRDNEIEISEIATEVEKQNDFNEKVQESGTETRDDPVDNEDVKMKIIVQEKNNLDNRRGDLEIKEYEEEYESETEDLRLEEEEEEKEIQEEIEERKNVIEIYVKRVSDWEIFQVLSFFPRVSCMTTIVTADDTLYLGICTNPSNITTKARSSTLYRFDLEQNQFVFHQMLNSRDATDMKHLRWNGHEKKQEEDFLIVSERDLSQNLVTSLIYKYADGMFVPLQHIVSADTRYVSWLSIPIIEPDPQDSNQRSTHLLLTSQINNELGVSVYNYDTHGSLFKQVSTVWFHETSSEIGPIRALDVNGLLVLTLTYKNSSYVSSDPNLFVFRFTSRNHFSILKNEMDRMMSEIERCDLSGLKRKIENGVEKNETRAHFFKPVILYNADVQYVYTEELSSKDSSVNMYIDLAVQDLDHFLSNVDEEIQTIT